MPTWQPDWLIAPGKVFIKIDLLKVAVLVTTSMVQCTRFDKDVVFDPDLGFDNNFFWQHSIVDGR